VLAARNLPVDTFINAKNGRFNLALFEAVFAATGRKAFEARRILAGELKPKEISSLESDPQFVEASLEGTTRTQNVEKRLSRAKKLISAL
jgi:hypothetical protein